MRKPHPVPLIILSLLTFAAGCHSADTSKQRYRETPGSYADPTARAAFIDNRVTEMTQKGMSKDEAVGRASREWFANAPIASESPTPQELKRRQDQAEFEADLAKRKKEASDR